MLQFVLHETWRMRGRFDAMQNFLMRAKVFLLTLDVERGAAALVSKKHAH